MRIHFPRSTSVFTCQKAAEQESARTRNIFSNVFSLALQNARHPRSESVRGEPSILSEFRLIFKWRRVVLSSTQQVIVGGREGYSDTPARSSALAHFGAVFSVPSSTARLPPPIDTHYLEPCTT